MTTIVRMSRELTTPPKVRLISGVRIRTFRDEADVELWLEIRHKAFARMRLGVPQWTTDDFRREFLSKSWWRTDQMWFAEPESSLNPFAPSAVGTVTLALREHVDGPQPVIHWLAVLPSWRRRGVARLLVEQLEARCWEMGHRRVGLETHSAWTAAMRLYESMGYVAE